MAGGLVNGRDAETLAQVLQDLQRILRDHICTFLSQRNIPFGHVALLRQLGEEDGLTISELGRRLGQSKGYVSVLVEQLQQEGLVRKVPDPADQRMIRVHVTPRAEDRREQFLREYRHFLAGLLSDLTPDEIRAITADLQRLRTTLSRRQA